MTGVTDLTPAGRLATTAEPTGEAVAAGRLPWAALLVMAFTGFLLIATETMPAGLLAPIADGMSISRGTAGQFVSAYALGTILATLPAVAMTRGMRRKPVYLVAIAGFLVANTVTAVSPDVVVSLAARFVAGAFSGLAWGMLAGYGRRIAPADRAGRALAIASLGTPVGLAVGTPFGSWLGTTWDWRWSFGVLSILTAIAGVLIAVLVPDAAGQRASSREPLGRVLALPGVALILAVIVAWMVGHNLVYTYLSSYLDTAGVPLSVDIALAVFGVAALLGVVVTGALVDRALRRLVLVSIAAFGVAGAVLLIGRGSSTAVVAAIVLWGLAYGGAATQLQTAISDASGENADVANSMLGVAFNLAIFTAGVAGALLVSSLGGLVLPVVMLGLAAAAFILATAGRSTAFPPAAPHH